MKNWAKERIGTVEEAEKDLPLDSWDTEDLSTIYVRPKVEAPIRPELKLLPENIAWHNENVYLG